ncbi:L-lactate dehydrogenase [Mycoplasmopsis meleagridis]|uniref:L-lactate dehydrogenase n=1 Tax=Mycoplasmopsis meleagridis ATCC 25294 TaxID=1264554 RepID=A0A0F5H1E4_9BACT|nr:lactate dehydrogenase [Mycoplasmopsis meleagridis]KKB26975.1 L-lactate dehydrogenase [Mycoplasmopsis meleagridis ATCC 25294]KUH47207.1 L-lactate dehydrogenase [Mycoplasmopsis meleagridis]OAD18564.1 L-lactate dehydrogenase [Mycoplasmopsis meleagridis]VEU77567.1 L-lactate dehydrogenase [Mycoplasmopsis meleagridis]
MQKIIIVGMGNVGATFVNIALARGMQAEFVFVDKNEEICNAHIHDFQDMVALMPRNNSTFRTGTLLEDSKDASIVLIAASIPAGKDFNDRLALAEANAKLMKSFGDDLVASKFKGVVIVAANPCDVMASIFTYACKIPAKKVISTGTLLDSARFRKFIAEKFNVSSDSIQGSVLGEHGAGAVPIWSTLKIADSSLENILKSRKIKKEMLPEIEKKTIDEAFYIFSRKGNTQFGIGTSIFEIVDCILNDKRLIMTIGVMLPKSYNNAGIYTSIPVILGKNGYEYLPLKVSFSDRERKLFEESTSHMAKVHEEILATLNLNVDLKSNK